LIYWFRCNYPSATTSTSIRHNKHKWYGNHSSILPNYLSLSCCYRPATTDGLPSWLLPSRCIPTTAIREFWCTNGSREPDLLC